jgi:alpha-L-fucosidase
MKKLNFIFLLSSFSFLLFAQTKPNEAYMKNYQQIMDRTSWWRNARFGMFIHFGAYAVPARGEWVKSDEKLTTAQYQKFVEAFNPVNFDAKKWAKIAKAAGMKYAVLTAKHHDGFCMFDSKLTSYTISHYFHGRDIVREFLDAFRAEGIKVGLYYSLIDWHHPDYPNVGNHPQRGDTIYGKWHFNWDNYLKYMHGQVEELMKNYGKIDILWFDYSFDNYSGEKWGAKALVQMIRKYQPDIILNNRLEVNQGTNTTGRVLGYGDFETPEQGIPDKGLTDRYGNPIPWETCMTTNNSWGYNSFDNQWKSSALIIQSLVNCVSKNGNLLLNVGPDARGVIPEPSVKILAAVGKWMDQNGASIYGCGASSLTKPEWGRYTQKGDILFAHWMYPNLGPIDVQGLIRKVKGVYLLSTGAEMPSATSWWGNSESNHFFINVNTPIYQNFERPDLFDTVFMLDL